MGGMHRSPKGVYSAICDECGFEFKSNQLRMRWDGLMVCAGCYETRNPQDFIRAIPDGPKLPFTRPEATDVFIGVCTIAGRHPIAGFGTADCAIVGYSLYSIEQLLLNYVCSVTGYLDQADLGSADCMTIGRTG